MVWDFIFKAADYRKRIDAARRTGHIRKAERLEKEYAKFADEHAVKNPRPIGEYLDDPDNLKERVKQLEKQLAIAR